MFTHRADINDDLHVEEAPAADVVLCFETKDSGAEKESVSCDRTSACPADMFRGSKLPTPGKTRVNAACVFLTEG
jgi:hypothetical protein